MERQGALHHGDEDGAGVTVPATWPLVGSGVRLVVGDDGAGALDIREGDRQPGEGWALPTPPTPGAR